MQYWGLRTHVPLIKSMNATSRGLVNLGGVYIGAAGSGQLSNIALLWNIFQRRTGYYIDHYMK